MKNHSFPSPSLRWVRSPAALLLLLAVAGALLFSPTPAVQAQTASTDATLSALNLNLADATATAVAVSPAFATATTAYTASVFADRVKVSPAPNDAGASYVVKIGDDIFDGGLVLLDAGDNAVTVVVTAADGATTMTYTVTVTRLEEVWSATVTAGSNTIWNGYLFDALATEQSDLGTGSIDDNAVVLGATTHTVTGVGSSLFDAGKPVVVLDPALDSDQLADLALVMDGTTYEFSAATTRTYTLTITGTGYLWTGTPSWTADTTFEVAINSEAALVGASPSTVAMLSALTVTDANDAAVSIGTFSGGTLSYAGTVSTASVTVAATPTNSKARKVAVRSGGVVHADGVVELALGLNTVTVEVTAPDDTTKQTYTIALTRNDPADAALSALTLSLTDADGTPVALTPDFAPDVTGYAAMALAETVRVAPTTRNASATFEVEVGGVGDYHNNELPLAAGANTVTVEVTAADGATMQTYTVTVTRLVEVWSTTVTAGSNNFGSGFIGSVGGTGTGSMTDDDERFTFLGVEYEVYMVGYATRCPGTKPQDCNRRAIYLTPIIPADAHPNWALVMDGTVYDFADTPATPGQDTNNYFGYGYTWAGDPFTAGDTFDVAIGSKVPIPSSDATLSALGLSAGTLKPPFAADTTTYTASVANSAASVTVTATKNHADATDPVIKKGATEYANGTVPLAVGDNVITVEVTAEDGVTTETYTVTVTRAAATVSTDATLSALTVSPGEIHGFDSAVTTYGVGVANSATSITVTPTANDDNATIIVNGTAVASGSAHTVSGLYEGRNTVNVVVTAQDENTDKTYTIDVGRGVTTAYGWKAVDDFNNLMAASNNGARGVWSDGATMWVADSGDDKLYAYNLSTKARDSARDFNTLDTARNNDPYGIWSDGAIMWVADIGDDKMYAYNLSTKARDSANDFDTLTGAGNNTPRGIWSDRATMWVADSDDDKLYAYNLSSKARDSAKDFDTLTGAGNNAPAGIWSDGATMWVADSQDDKLYAYNLSTKARDSAKDFGTLIAAGNRNMTGIWSDGATMWVADSTDDKAYSYNMPKSDNATLSALGLSAGTLKPPFAAGTTTYTASVANSAASVTVTATTNDANASAVIKKGATEYADGTVPLDVGDNAITVEVTAEDGVSTQTYTVTVTRAAATVSTVAAAVRLSGLTTDIGALSPAFAPDTTGYAIGLAAADSEIIVRPVTADAAATVSYVDGANAAIADADSAADGYQIPLAFGENTVKVRVAKGSDSQDYTLTVTRAKQPAVIAYMSSASVLVYWKDPVAAGCPNTDTADTTDDDYKVYLEVVAGTWSEYLSSVNANYTPAGVLVKPAGYLSRYFSFSTLIYSADTEVWCGTRNGAGSRKVGGDIADFYDNQPSNVTLSGATSFTPNDQNFAGISGVPSSGHHRQISDYRATVAHDAVHTTVTITRPPGQDLITRLYDAAGQQLTDADTDAAGFQVAIAGDGRDLLPAGDQVQPQLPPLFRQVHLPDHPRRAAGDGVRPPRWRRYLR